MTAGDAWRTWTYSDWNERLLRHYFHAVGDKGSEAVERIPATPEELSEIADETDRSDPSEVAHIFVSRVLEQMPYGLSFCAFCRDRQGWTPDSPNPPHYFAALWLTCLVSYGYPHEGGGFHDRMTEVLGRRQNFECLPGLWRDLERWTEVRKHAAGGGSRVDAYRELILPPPDDYRSTIGFSWFLAFPHERDRRRLREILSREDLVGEEPPLIPAVAALVRYRGEFAGSFREDLDNFVSAFVDTGADVSESAFWRAVRREALAPAGYEAAAATGHVELRARFDDNEDLRPYLTCTMDVVLPLGYASHPLPDEPGTPTHYVTADASDDPQGIDRVVEAALRGEAIGTEIARHARRGVLIFQVVLTGIYRLAGGSLANEADVALVRENLVADFLQAYGGSDEPSRFSGWRQVTGCEVTIRREPPPGLEGVLHLQETMVPPSVRLVDGVRATEGYLALPNFLPKIRFRDAERVELLDTRGELAAPPRRDASDADLWHFPSSSVNWAPGSLTLRVHWRDAGGRSRISERRLVLAGRQMDFAYKPLGAGRYFVESTTPGQAETNGGEDIPLGVVDGPLHDEEGTGPELAALDPTVRYLGPNVGEFSRTPRPGFDWLVVGPKNHPDVLMFVGDPEEPVQSFGGSCRDAGARRHWHAAIRCRRVAVLAPGGRVTSVREFPAVEDALRRYRLSGIHSGGSRPVDNPHCKVPEFPPIWSGVSPAPPVADIVDALAALAVRKSGVRYRELFDLLSAVVGARAPIRPDTIHQLIRAWVEAGFVDVAYSQGRPATYISARRPRFVAYTAGGVVRAALVGLVPRTLESVVARTVEAGGGRCDYVRPPCPWLPSVLRMECDLPGLLSEVSSELGLATPRWLSWPGNATREGVADLLPETQGLDGVPHASYRVESFWTPGLSRFVGKASADPQILQQSDVLVEKRGHRDRVPVYTLLVDGEPLAHAHIRNWVLLLAYSLGDAPLPFHARPDGPIVRHGRMGVYLPLPVGRLCAVLGEGLAGPVIAGDDVTVEEYVYPLGAAHRWALVDWIPLIDSGYEEGER